MFVLGPVGEGLSRAEATAALIGLATLACAVIWLLLRWITSGPLSLDPWNDEVAAELKSEDCTQICHRCLTPQETLSHFCPHCGAMVGTHTCLMPPLHLYVIGDVFRAGAEGTYRRSAWLLMVYVLIAFNYLYWVPFPFGLIALVAYWMKLFTNIPKYEMHQSEGT